MVAKSGHMTITKIKKIANCT